MAKKLRTLKKKEMKAIYEGLEKANLKDYKISALHLRPRFKSVGAAANDGNNCHSQELPNGHFIIVCE
jgi:hypothetical protein